MINNMRKKLETTLATVDDEERERGEEEGKNAKRKKRVNAT